MESLPTTAAQSIDLFTLLTHQQAQNFLIRLEFNGKPHYKFHRDTLGIYIASPTVSGFEHHYATEHVVDLKPGASYAEVVEAINGLAILKDRPGKSGIESVSAEEWKARSSAREDEGKGKEGENGVMTLKKLVKKMKVSAEVEIAHLGVVWDLPGVEKGYTLIEKDGSNVEGVLKLVAKRGFRDLLVADYRETGKVVRF